MRDDLRVRYGEERLPRYTSYPTAPQFERVMCDFRVDVGEICRRHETVPEIILQAIPKLRMLQDDGIVHLEGHVLSVNDNARFLVRSVASAFDAHLGASGRTHSRAV